MANDDTIGKIGSVAGNQRSSEVAGSQYAAEAGKTAAPPPPPQDEATKGIDQSDKVQISDEAKGISAQPPQAEQKVQGANETEKAQQGPPPDAQKGLEETLSKLQAEREGQKQQQQ